METFGFGDYTSALSVTSYTHNSVTVSVTDAGDANNYDFYCTTSSTAPTSETTPSASNTSKTPTITGLTASTTYYIYVRSKCSSTSFSSWVYAGSTFTTSASPTLSALVSGTGYTPADMLPTSMTISTDPTYAEGLSDNTKFFIVGDADNEGDDGGVPEIKTKPGDRITVNETNYDDHCYFKKGAAKSGQIPTSHAIKFILPTSGNLYVIGNGSKINLVKDDAESPTTLSFTSNEATVTGLAAGTYYMYATGTSQRIEYLKFTTAYAVTLNDNNGGDHNGSANAVANGTALTSISAPTRSGYAVTGYYAEAECNTLVAGANGAFEANVTVSAVDWTDGNGKWIKGSGATLYAKWGAVYTVTFNTNGGSSVDAITQASVGASITMPAAPTKSGYTFNGWQIGSTYAVGASYTPTANVTAYATWNESCDASSIFNFTVNNSGDDLTVARNGGSLSLTTSNAFSTLTGGTVTVVNTNTNSGGPDKMVGSDNSERHVRFTSTSAYLTLEFSEDLAQGDVIEFTGNGSAQIYITTSTTYSSSIVTSTNKLTIPESSPLIGVSTIYIWPVSTSTRIKTLSITRPTSCYYITYNGNGATSGYVNDDDAYAEDADPTIASNGYTKTGYTFRCWNTQPDRSGDDYAAGATYTDIKADVTLYAIWVKNENVDKYTFHYGNNSTSSWEDPVAFSQVGSTHEWNIANYTVPDQTDYPNLYVGYEGYKTAKSVVTTWFDNSAEDVSGKLIITDNSAEDNYDVAFAPSGYGVTLSGSSQTLAFKATTTANLWETDPVTLVTGDISGTFTVKLKTSDGYTTCSISEAESAATVNGRKISGTADMANEYKGRFQIWSNETSTDNFALRFVPMENRTLGGGSWNGISGDADEDFVATSKWSLGRIPTIDDDVVILHSTPIYRNNARANSVKIDKSVEERNYLRLSIDYTGGLVVKTSITAKHVGDADFGPTTPDDIIIETMFGGNGGLVIGGASTTTQAEYRFLSSAWRAGNYIVNQYIGIPFTSMSVYDYYGVYAFVYDDEADQWTAASETLEPFVAYNFINKTSLTRYYYYLDGSLNLPGLSGKVVLTCGSRYNADGTFDGAHKEDTDNGDHMFANSFTAPIDISSMTPSDFSGTDGSEMQQTIYIFNAGNNGTEDKPKELGENAGQWSSFPIGASSYMENAIIPGMNAFLVTAKASGAKLTLDYYKHVYKPALDNGVNNFPTRAPRRDRAEGAPVKLKMMVKSDSVVADNIYIFEREDFSYDFDNGWDGNKIFGKANVPQLYTIRWSTNLAVDAVPEMEGTLIGFKAGTDTNSYTLSFEYNGAEPLYLYDMDLNVFTQITNEATYSFTTYDTAEHQRFMLTRSNSPSVSTWIEPVEGERADDVKKVIINDHIYIIRGGKMYSVDGAIVK